ncbi:hypothetical protein [Patulibacter sp.]|uniref:hypothetical protein n=1 Tax=Patulibacter sp. TaxID=1912859 RepID=UPI0027292255|nr:hypothetical protein [Patulibacter sp.]MDO9407137.1 hypothetical protein [Patulibacter sp.]
MNVPARLTGFAVLLAVVFGGSVLAGAAIDPTDDAPGGAAHAPAHDRDRAPAGHGGGDEADHPAGVRR